MANYDSNYAIAQEISARLGNSPIPFDSVYSICEEIYRQLGGVETGFDSVYSILLAILPLVEGGGAEVEKLLRLIELMGSTGINVETTSVSSMTIFVQHVDENLVTAIIWGDGTFTETDGDEITNGDTAQTIYNNGCLIHTYTSSKAQKIKVIGTSFCETFNTQYNITDCVKSLKINKGVLYIAYIIPGQNSIRNIQFDDECQTELNYYAFGYVNGHLENMYLPKGVTIKGNGQFFNMLVDNFIFAEGSSITGITKYFNYFNQGYSRYNVNKLVIPEGIVSIDRCGYAIMSPYYNGSVEKIQFPSSLTTIQGVSFSYVFADGAVIDLPSGVTTIGDKAFMRGYNNNNGRCNYTMISRALVPPTAQADSFNAVDGYKPTDCVLYVPNDSIAAYSVATGWKEFGTILPIESMGFGVATNAEIEQMF